MSSEPSLLPLLVAFVKKKKLFFSKKEKKQILILCHYPILSFNHIGREAIHLYGHVHGAIERSDYCAAKYIRSLKTLDVGIDNAKYLFGEYRPFNLKNDIVPLLLSRASISLIDHH